jgi:hypothetical protein
VLVVEEVLPEENDTIESTEKSLASSTELDDSLVSLSKMFVAVNEIGEIATTFVDWDNETVKLPETFESF